MKRTRKKSRRPKAAKSLTADIEASASTGSPAEDLPAPKRKGCGSVVLGMLLIVLGIPMLVLPGPGLIAIGSGIVLVLRGIGLRGR